MKLNKKHRGEILYNVIQASGLKLTTILERAGYHRSTYYTHVKNPDLSFNIIFKYGKAIPHDFSFQFPEIEEYFSRPAESFNPTIQENEAPFYGQLPREAMMKYTDSLKDKYIAVLEENRELRIKIETIAEKLRERNNEG